MLVPVCSKQAEWFVFGELKDVMHRLKEVGEKAHDENKKLYLEAREKYDQVYKRLQEIERQLASMPGKHDISTLETRQLLSEEKRTLEGDLYQLSDMIDQLFDKDFVPEKPKGELKPEPDKREQEQPNLTGTGRLEKVIDPKSNGQKVRQLRYQLNEAQHTFAKRFGVTQMVVSNWETNKTIPPKEVMKLLSASSSKSEKPITQCCLSNFAAFFPPHNFSSNCL